MSFFDRITQGVPGIDLRHGGGLTPHLVETGEYCGFSYLAGRVNTQYDWKIRGMPATHVAGVVAKVAAVAADIWGFGDGWAHHANTASNPLLGAYFTAKGAEHGIAAKSAQRSLPAASARASLPAVPAKTTTSLGAIPLAPTPGKYLDLDRVAAIAAM